MAYCDTDKKVELLKKCITDLKDKNKDIFLTTHYPVSFDIQKMVEYYYYDHNNDILNHKNNGFIKYNVGMWTFETINNHKIIFNYLKLDPDIMVHAYAIWTLIQNAIALTKIKKYKKIHIIDYDVLIGQSDILEEHNKILDEKDCVIYYTHRLYNIFSMTIESADKIFSLYKDIDDYFLNERLDFLFENRVYQLLLRDNISFHQFSGEDLIKKTVYLNGNSEIKNKHYYRDLFYENEHFYFIIIPDLDLNNHIIIDNKKSFEYECYLTIDDCIKQIQINKPRQSIKLDVNKKEYELKITVNNTILFNNTVKVKEHVHYEKQ
jgi:hypothetical protein